MTETRQKPVVLAVDDTPENLDVVKGILANDYTVKAAINGEMALKIVEKSPPDLILLDIMMPGLSGYEVCEQLKSNTETADIPVIFLTAMEQTTDEAKGFELGASDYITKPVNPPILEARVKTHLVLNQAYSIIKGQKDRMEEELNVGRNIQMSMVPLEFPAFPDRDEFDLHALLKPAREVGGDFYDYFLVNQDELCVVVGDVSGKGVPAALFMAVTRTMMKTRASDDNSPASIMTAVNDELSADNSESMFVTLFLGIFNIRTGDFRYTNAGHNLPYIRRVNGEIDTIQQVHGPVAGAMEGLAYKQDSLTLQPGDLLLMFTDGVSEAMDAGSNLFGEQRIIDYLSNMEGTEPKDTVDGLADAVDVYADEEPQFDDITILALRCNQSLDAADTEQLDLQISNELAEIGKAIEAFEAFSEETDLPMAIAMKANLVFDELLNNIVSYAFTDEGEHQIGVHIERSKDRLLLIIEDDGMPFNPFAQSEVDTTLSIEERDIGGLGIHLVMNVMDDVSYERRKDRNVVTLIKKLED
jgi:sigma-B regulation protein RsbU (phosphoserine phosphatase)